MSRVRIVTDSTAELSQEEADELEITVQPLHVRLGSEVLTDGPHLRSPEFHRRITKGKLIPSITVPSAHQMGELYAQITKTTDQILSIHAGERFYPLVRAARLGRGNLLGKSRIMVLDSGLVSLPLGIVVRQAAQAARAGMGLDALVRAVRGYISTTYCAFYVENLDYMKRAGMMPSLQDAIGITPNIKPLFIIEEGRIAPLQRLRNRGTAIERLTEFVAEFNGFEELAVLHSGITQDGDDLQQHLGTLYPVETIRKHTYGPSLGCLLGPYALGVTVFEPPSNDSRPF